MVIQLEHLMYQLSDFFMAPVLILIAILFIYALYATGRFMMQTAQRKKNYSTYTHFLSTEFGQNKSLNLQGYALADFANHKPDTTKEQLDVEALKTLEGVRNVSRLAPMLGLIATMVPMGPALKSLADGNIQGISENLIVAFSAVIFGLVIASITFWIASVQKRWLAEELVALMPLVDKQTQKLANQVHAVDKVTNTTEQKNEAA